MQIIIEVSDDANNRQIIEAIFPHLESIGSILMDDDENIIATNVDLQWLKRKYKE